MLQSTFIRKHRLDPYRIAIVVTSISAPNAALRALAAGALDSSFGFVVIGDAKSPFTFKLDGCDFHDLASQSTSGFATASLAHVGHYARKNIGYLLAIRGGAKVILETDDDNLPEPTFWQPRMRRQTVSVAQRAGWSNVYGWFSDNLIWPRGLPLETIQTALDPFDGLAIRQMDCPIQQGLADDDPDVDAVYRLLFRSPAKFRRDRSVALGAGAWCPFNSQNTTWFSDAFPLLYLPTHCSFRMTDIWRSFVAQRIAWENGWSVLFHGPTVRQERNAHDLMRDFEQEIPGYLNNRAIAAALEGLDLLPGPDRIGDNLRTCYRRLVEGDWLDRAELHLLDAWLADLAQLESDGRTAAHNSER